MVIFESLRYPEYFMKEAREQRGEEKVWKKEVKEVFPLMMRR